MESKEGTCKKRREKKEKSKKETKKRDDMLIPQTNWNLHSSTLQNFKRKISFADLRIGKTISNN